MSTPRSPQRTVQPRPLSRVLPYRSPPRVDARAADTPARSARRDAGLPAVESPGGVAYVIEYFADSPAAAAAVAGAAPWRERQSQEPQGMPHAVRYDVRRVGAAVPARQHGRLHYAVRVPPGARLAWVETLDDARAFAARYGVAVEQTALSPGRLVVKKGAAPARGPPVARTLNYTLISWREVARDYDGIVLPKRLALPPGEATGELFWLLLWQDDPVNWDGMGPRRSTAAALVWDSAVVADAVGPFGRPAAGLAPKAAKAKGKSPKAGTPKAAKVKGTSPNAGTPKAGTPKAGTPKAGTPKAAKAKGKSPTAAKPKGKPPTAAKPKGKPPTAAKPKGKPPTAAKAKGKPPRGASR